MFFVAGQNTCFQPSHQNKVYLKLQPKLTKKCDHKITRPRTINEYVNKKPPDQIRRFLRPTV